MTHIEKRPGAIDPEVEVADCQKIVVDTEQIKEKETMFDLKPTPFAEFGDKTYESEVEVKRFLETLTEAQLAETEVLVDDDSFVVFYPLLPTTRPSGYHFDTDYPRPTVSSPEVPELIGLVAEQSRQAVSAAERQAGLAILLASVRL